MESQVPQRLAHSSSSGHENHGVHVCHKCGWPFPNPHPSAKHRRAHKKVCGTIEGYKLGGVDLEGSSHSNLSDDDDGGDRKTTSSNVLGDSGTGKGSGGTGELSNRLEEEVFSDAVTEFLDTGKSLTDAGDLAVNEEKVLGKESDAIRFVECGPVAEAVKSSPESIQVQHSETPVSTINTLGNAPEFSRPSSSVTEDSALLLDSEANASGDDFKPTKDASFESEKTGDVDADFNGCSTLDEPGAGAEGKKETYSVISSPGIQILPDAVKSLLSIPDDDSINLKIPEADVSPEVESVEHANPVTDITEGTSYVNSDELTEKNVLSVSDDLKKTNSGEVMLEDFKDHKAYLDQSATSDFKLAKEIDDTEGLVGRSNNSESTAISASGSHVLVKEVPVEEDSGGLSQIDNEIHENLGYDETVATKDVAMPEMEKGIPEKEYNDVTSVAHTVNSLNFATHLVGEDDNHGKPLNSDISGDACDELSNHLKSESGKSANSAPESAEKLSEFKSDHEIVLQDIEADHEKKVEIEKGDIITGDYKDEIKVYDNIHSSPKEGFSENLVSESATKTQQDIPVELIMTSESARTGAEDVVVVESVEKILESAPGLRSVGVDTVSDTKQGVSENKPDAHEKAREVTPSLNSDDNNQKEIVISSLDSNSPIQISARESMNGVVGGSVIDILADSSSQTDSLENNWGSVSVLSVQSDAQAVVDAETTPPPTESRPVMGERTGSKNSDKSEMFEPPSFMTLVEPGGKNVQNPNAPEIEASQEPSPSALKAGWFPSITHVANESQGRKKNEEIIAKVTNWSTGKQHTPLKSLLGEASQDNNNNARAKSPKRRENPGPVGSATVNSIIAPESPLAQAAADREIGKEWNSPARYPTEIKREKRKPKSRPYWAQFMCCSSVH